MIGPHVHMGPIKTSTVIPAMLVHRQIQFLEVFCFPFLERKKHLTKYWQEVILPLRDNRESVRHTTE